MNTDVTAEQLLEEVKKFGRSVVGSSWQDYERFKTMFHNHGLYGYEKDIADALNL